MAAQPCLREQRRQEDRSIKSKPRFRTDPWAAARRTASSVGGPRRARRGGADVSAPARRAASVPAPPRQPCSTAPPPAAQRPSPSRVPSHGLRALVDAGGRHGSGSGYPGPAVSRLRLSEPYHSGPPAAAESAGLTSVPGRPTPLVPSRAAPGPGVV